MTVDAIHGVLTGRTAPDDVVDEVGVAAETALLEDPRVAWLDHDRIVKVHEREALRVVPAVAGLREVLRDEPVRQVAVHAAGNGVMRPVLPRRVLVVHHVAVVAGAGIRREVAEAFGVAERVRAKPSQGADEYRDYEHAHGGKTSGLYDARAPVPSTRCVVPGAVPSTK